ncbi:nuclear transport factor 2 family protein [Mycobacterium intracellulare]|uniref:nuclear transport factor 2 family protein n=1 Tax=Mycobacterium intracellulare TaxID=1767 RepID=UPI0033613DC0
MTSIAEKYIDAVNRADIDELMALFAPTATLRHPSGTFVGAQDIANFYKTVVFTGKAVTEIQTRFRDRGSQIIQIRATSPLAEPGQYVYAADIFTISDEQIEGLDIYYR